MLISAISKVIGRVKPRRYELMHPSSREVKMPPLRHNRVIFAQRRLREERFDEEVSDKAFYIK
jgi:hypothetical protein